VIVKKSSVNSFRRLPRKRYINDLLAICIKRDSGRHSREVLEVLAMLAMLEEGSWRR
jgi:hypothetical protein